MLIIVVRLNFLLLLMLIENITPSKKWFNDCGQQNNLKSRQHFYYYFTFQYTNILLKRYHQCIYLQVTIPQTFFSHFYNSFKFKCANFISAPSSQLTQNFNVIQDFSINIQLYKANRWQIPFLICTINNFSILFFHFFFFD